MASRDRELRERAARVIPGGMYGHQSVGPLPPGYPQFFSRADNMFLSAAMTEDDIDFAIDTADASFRALAERV